MPDDEVMVPADEADPDYVDPFAETGKDPEAAPAAADGVKVPADVQPDPSALVEDTDPEAEVSPGSDAGALP